MYGNLWMGAVATAGRGEGGWSSPRMTVAGRWLVQGGREEKESLPRAVVLALSGRPTSRPPRSRRIAPVSPPPAFVGPLVPPFSNARTPFFVHSPPLFLTFPLSLCFHFPRLSSLISSPNSSISRVSRSNRSQENSEKFYLTFPPFECYFDFAFRFPSFLLVDLDRVS